MTQPSIIVPLQQENLEEIANPYKANKPWHNTPNNQVESAESLFYDTKEVKPTVVEPEESATSTEEGANPDNHDYKKRWVDLKNHYDTKQKQWKEKLASYESGDSVTIPFQAPKTEDELESFKQENPEFYSFMESIAHKRSQEESSDVKAQLSEIEVRERALATKQALKEIVDAHEDFTELRNSEDFHEWADAQPKGIQEWIYNNPTDSALAIRAIDLYKADVGKIDAGIESTRQEQIRVEDAASLVSTKPTDTPVEEGKRIWTSQEVNRLTPDQYDQYEAEIDLAIMEGRFRD